MTAASAAPDPHDATQLAAFVRSASLGVVATVDAAGAPEAATVGFAALDDGTLIFDTYPASRKAVNIRANPRVATVFTRGAVTVQAEGSARIVEGAERDALADAYAAQHPDSRVHDPELIVVAISPDWVRTYDASGADATVVEASWS